MPELKENNKSEILIYKNPDGDVRLDVRLEDESVWLTQAHMAKLFDKGRSTITEHICNIFAESELDENVVCRNFRHTTQHGAIDGKTQSWNMSNIKISNGGLSVMRAFGNWSGI